MDNINSMKSVRDKTRGLTNLWLFESNKNSKRFSIRGDTDFAQLVLLEGDVSVRSYDLYPIVVRNSPSFSAELVPLALVEYNDGAQKYIQCVEKESNLKQEVLKYNKNVEVAHGYYYELISNVQVWSNKILIDNWIFLSSVIARAKRFSMHREMQLAVEAIIVKKITITLEELLNIEGIDPSLMLGAVGLLLQRGAIHADLETELFSYATVMGAERNG